MPWSRNFAAVKGSGSANSPGPSKQIDSRKRGTIGKGAGQASAAEFGATTLQGPQVANLASLFVESGPAPIAFYFFGNTQQPSLPSLTDTKRSILCTPRVADSRWAFLGCHYPG